MNRDPDKDEALFRLLAASDDPRAAFEASPLAGDAYSRARFDDVLGMASDLDALGTEERASLLRALEGTVESGPAEAAFRGSIQNGPVAGGPVASGPVASGPVASGRGGILRGPWRGVLIAAALVALCALPFLTRSGGDGGGPAGPGPIMGTANGMSPRGTIDAVESFRWPAREQAGGRTRVFVYDGSTQAEVLASPPIEHDEWRPKPAQLALLNEGPRPRSFTWKVSFDDGSGAEPFEEWREFELR